jgi:hypothetical protein
VEENERSVLEESLLMRMLIVVVLRRDETGEKECE